MAMHVATLGWVIPTSLMSSMRRMRVKRVTCSRPRRCDRRTIDMSRPDTGVIDLDMESECPAPPRPPEIEDAFVGSATESRHPTVDMRCDSRRRW